MGLPLSFGSFQVTSMLWAVMSSICGLSGASGVSEAGGTRCLWLGLQEHGEHFDILVMPTIRLKTEMKTQQTGQSYRTERILGYEWFGDAVWTSAVFILRSDPEDVLLFLDEFGHQVAAASQCGGDAAPADLNLRVVLLLQNVVEDFTAAIVQRRIPLTNHRVLPHLLKPEVHWWPRSIYRQTISFYR